MVFSAGACKILEAGRAALAEPFLEGQEVTSRRRQADSSVALHSPCGRESGELASNGGYRKLERPLPEGGVEHET